MRSGCIQGRREGRLYRGALGLCLHLGWLVLCFVSFPGYRPAAAAFWTSQPPCLRASPWRERDEQCLLILPFFGLLAKRRSIKKPFIRITGPEGCSALGLGLVAAKMFFPAHLLVLESFNKADERDS